MSQINKNIKPASNSLERESLSQENQSFWKTSLIKALRGTIGILENTAVKLETQTLPKNQKKLNFLQKFQLWWSGILGKIRLILPAKLSAKLTDTALTGIITGIAVFLFLITSNFLGSKPPQIAKVSPQTVAPQVESTTKSDTIASKEETVTLESEKESVSEQQEEEEIVILPTKDESISEQQEKIPTLLETQNNASLEETASLTSQEEITTESSAVIESQTNPSSDEVTISNPETDIPSMVETPQEELETNPPQIPLTPEETLITTIQNQIRKISDSEIIESIQVNFLDSNLKIKINNNWYNLEKSQQNKLAAEILQHSQELDFTHLEITDLQNQLIARNSVLGNQAIIFKR